VDSNRFDNLARIVGEQTDRRRMLKVAAGSALAVAGLGALTRTALGEDVSAESNGFKGDSCDGSNSSCKKGLICNSNFRCEYRNNCGGKKNQACKNNGDCCKNQNLECDNRKCKRKKNNR
jgi:hypothetical protein